jgi:hypothetical protein
MSVPQGLPPPGPTRRIVQGRRVEISGMVVYFSMARDGAVRNYQVNRKHREKDHS